ncbi:MAG TPA: hypothetical protein ENK82_06305 [Campylobacterales bacterium]|nr:hypothetical protein [Campylobacterales bacterium]HHS92942.1 hypothetical protein [Campylobacterales bacterium]
MKLFAQTLTLLLFISSLNAQEVEMYSSQNYYAKPGAPITISHAKKIVADVNQTIDVNLTLSSSSNSGKLHVITVVDPKLKSSSTLDTNASFDIRPDQQEFLMNFQVTPTKEGILYIKLLTEIKTDYSKKSRSFAVPIYVGEYEKPLIKSKSSNSFKALGSTENISISKAKETVEVIKEK